MKQINLFLSTNRAMKEKQPTPELHSHIEDVKEYVRMVKVLIRKEEKNKASKALAKTHSRLASLEAEFEFQENQTEEPQKLAATRKQIAKLRRQIAHLSTELTDFELEYVNSSSSLTEEAPTMPSNKNEESNGGEKHPSVTGGQNRLQRPPMSQETQLSLQTRVELKRFDETIEMSQETTTILTQTIALNEKTIQIGADAAEMLKTQSQRMKEIEDNLASLGTGIKRAKRELGALMRSVFCDKCICLMIVIALIVFAVMVVLKIIFPQYFTWQNISRVITNQSSKQQ